MLFGFNNQFIKDMITRPIFQKIPKKYFVFFFSIWIMNLYVKHIPDIKKEVPFY
jgi:Rad3-related DNA helicase